MNNFSRDWKHFDTSEKMNKYEQAFYGVIFVVLIVAVVIVLPAMLMAVFA
jgi:FlaG/FlaF family flagellin (archaellin)